MNYNHSQLCYLLSMWWGMRDRVSRPDIGYNGAAPVHRNAVSSRQFDSDTSVMDDDLDRSTAHIVGDGVEALPYRERALVIFTHCGNFKKSILVDNIPMSQRPGMLKSAMDKLAAFVMSKGVEL